MKIISKWAQALSVGLILSGGVCGAQSVQVHAKALPEGVAASMANIRPQQMEMNQRQPKSLKTLPPDAGEPVFGSLKLGPLEAQTRIHAMMDANATGEPRMWIDSNNNGDLTDDPPIQWTKTTYPSFDGSLLTLYQGSAVVQVRYPSGILPLRLHLLRYDPNDPNRAGFRNTVLYQPDYARDANLKLGAKTYHALLYDCFALGDFRGNHDPNGSGIALYIDVNGNGKFEEQGEQFDAWQPFNIKGVTYELANMTPDGSVFEVVRSKRSVAEIPLLPELGVGKPVIPFTKPRLDGQTAHFPADYKGKFVLLYFWASYCPKCQAEIPYVRDAYRQFHAKGVDILGVSLDPGPDVVKIPIAKYVEDSHMPWPEIYEGKFYQGELPHLYSVTETPTSYLVDGDTGKILAIGPALLGTRLAETLQKAITARKAN